MSINNLKSMQNYILNIGNDKIYYLGSYWGSVFHEDGVNSAIRTCKLLV
jgi:predicted NAD/FAD-binding protein